MLYIPIILSFLILVAHFLRDWNLIFAAIFLISPFLLFIKRRWTSVWIQILLVVGSVEWLKTIWLLVSSRLATGHPYLRMVLILGCVTLLTILSLLVFRTQKMKNRYVEKSNLPED